MDNKKNDNKIDNVINEALESKRLQQTGRFIKKAIFIGVGLSVLVIVITSIEYFTRG